MSDHETTQEEVARFLSEGRNWPGDVEEVVRLETHISRVFLGGDIALKMKKAVRLPYLDFSTLEKRRVMCRRELEINRRFSPRLYPGLSRVTREADGRLALEGAGEVVEWLVRMRRFDSRDILANILRAGPPSPELTRALARMAADSHAAAERRPEVSGRAVMARTLEELDGALGGSAGARKLLARLEALLARHGDLLERRGDAGFVRRCHGDMHAGNVVLWAGRPRLFDALEFSEALASVDILHDFAFLLMDLIHEGFRFAANRLFNLWLQFSPEEENYAALGLTELFCAARAAIRCMVLRDLARQKAGAERARRQAAAEAYLDTALSCARAPRRPAAIAVGGLSGSGKSTLAAALAARVGPGPGAAHIRSDVERKLMAGVDEFTRLAPESYTPESSQAVYARMSRKAEMALRSGWPVVMDAVFSKEEERRAAADMARAAGADFTGLWLEAPAEILRRRVGRRRHDASDATPDVVEKQLARGAGTVEWRVIDASGSPKETLRRALAALPSAD